MSQGLMHKLKNWVSGDPFEDDMFGGFDDEYAGSPQGGGGIAEDPRAYRQPSQPRQQDFEPMTESSSRRRKNLKVVEAPNSGQQQVVVIEPRAFEEALEIIDHLRTKKSVLLNLHLLDPAQSQRVVDFLSGATHAIDGNQQRIGDGVFMFTPNNVTITAEAQRQTLGQPSAPVQPGATAAPAAAAPSVNLTDAFWSQAR